MLEVQKIETFYGSSQVLFGIDLKIKEGQAVTLLGRNGMGKTTTVRSIIGLTPTHRGKILLDNTEIQHLPSYRIARLGVGLVPEGRQIFPNLSVKENLLATARNPQSFRSGKPLAPWTFERVLQIFPILAQRQKYRGDQLSGGEQQMLSIGRALMTNPRLLILDEATEGLAPLVRKEIWRCLEVLKKTGQSILVIDKHIESLLRFADHHYILERGRIVWRGDSALLSEDKDSRRRFLGL